MKRIAFVLSALAFTGAAAFAQDAPVAKVGGYVNAGVKVTTNSDGTVYQSHASDAGYDGWVGKISASLAASNYGVSVTGVLKQGQDVIADTAYAWLSPFEGFKLEAGSGNDNPLGELDDNGEGAFSTAGVTALYSISGFTAGLVVSPTTAGDDEAALTFGARYALDKLATFNLTAGTAGSKFDWYRATASLSGVENLSASAGYNATALNGTKDAFIDVSVGYQITEALKAGVVVYSYSADTAPDVTLTYKPNVSYSLGNGMTLSAYLLGDNHKVQPNYQAQGEFDYTVGAGTIRNTISYDTAPNHVKDDKATTTLETDFLFSF